MAEFDIVSKQLVKDYPADFVRFTLDQEAVEVLEVLDTEQPTVESRRTDSFIRVRIEGLEALVHTEFQTDDSTNPPMPRRMAGYIGRAIESDVQMCKCANMQMRKWVFTFHVSRFTFMGIAPVCAPDEAPGRNDSPTVAAAMCSNRRWTAAGCNEQIEFSHRPRDSERVGV